MLNHIVLMGRLTADPEYKQTDTYKLCRIKVACDRDYQRGKERETDFVDCTAFGGTADFVQKFFSKGDMIVVTGRLQIDTNKETKRTYTSIKVDTAYFGGTKKEKTNESEGQTRFQELNGQSEGNLPF